jgi:hypothetical protein
LACGDEGNELIQQYNIVAKRREPMEVEVYIKGSLKKLAVGLRFKSQTMFG